MVGFEISLNGVRKYTVTVGELGMLFAEVTWMRNQTKAGPIFEELTVGAKGLISHDGDHLKWPTINAEVGDEVRIRIVDTVVSDAPFDRRPHVRS